jgi:gluconate kinase
MPIQWPENIKVIYFFGLAGVGKNFIADHLGKQLKVEVYHADSDLTPAMRDAIARKEVFTSEMRDEYYAKIAEIINLRVKDQGRLLVTQGTYKREHREMLVQRVPGLFFIWIDAPMSLILERLRARGDSISEDYGAKISSGFETPDEEIPRLVNVGEASEVRSQLELIIEKFQ